jgi:hypothetical protein
MSQIRQHGKGDSLDPIKEAGNLVTIFTCPWTFIHYSYKQHQEIIIQWLGEKNLTLGTGFPIVRVQCPPQPDSPTSIISAKSGNTASLTTMTKADIISLHKP